MKYFDFCFKRYGNLNILDKFIEQNQFYKLILDSWSIHNEEELFEVWLHKIDNKSFEEFKEMCKPAKPTQKKEIAETIRESMQIINLDFGE